MQLIQGQFYRIGYTGRNDAEIATVDCLVIASSIEDAKSRFPYIVDLSEYTSYRIDYVVKEPGRSYQVRMKIERSPIEHPDACIKRNEGSQSVWQKLDAINGKKWEVYARTTCFAKSPIHAQRKLAERLSGGSERVECVATEVAASSGFATAKDMSMFDRASFVRG
jgi:hypothetical protein